MNWEEEKVKFLSELNDDLFNWVVMSPWQARENNGSQHSCEQVTQQPPEPQGKKTPREHIFLCGRAWAESQRKGLKKGAPALLLSIPSQLVCEGKLVFNLYLHNYLAIIKNTVLRINHFSRYMSSNEKLRVWRENNFKWICHSKWSCNYNSPSLQFSLVSNYFSRVYVKLMVLVSLKL